MTRLRVEVVRDRCAGYANCLEAAPDVFDLDEHDVAVVAEVDFPVEARAHLDNAARRCPAKAITVIEM